MEAPTIENKLIKIIFNEYKARSISLREIKKQSYWNSQLNPQIKQELERETNLYLLTSLVESTSTMYEDVFTTVIDFPVYSHDTDSINITEVNGDSYKLNSLGYNLSWTVTKHNELKLKYYDEKAVINPMDHNFVRLEEYKALVKTLVGLVETRTPVLLIFFNNPDNKLDFTEERAIVESAIVEDRKYVTGLKLLTKHASKKKTLRFNTYKDKWLLILR